MNGELSPFTIRRAHGILDGNETVLLLLDSILTLLVDERYNICHMGRDCRQYFVVEHNGDIYPCDFFVEAPRRLGNILEDNWERLLESPLYRAFGTQKSRWHPDCDQCRYLRFCSGDCLKHRLHERNDPKTRSWLCHGWKTFYGHALPGFKRLATAVRKERRQQREATRRNRPAATPPGTQPPNLLCPCGSGRLYHICCGRR